MWYKGKVDFLEVAQMEKLSPTATTGRYIARQVKAAVFERDNGQCTFVGTDGRCAARQHLEFEHCKPFALGGDSTLENLTHRCRAHNMLEAERVFGKEKIQSMMK